MENTPKENNTKEETQAFFLTLTLSSLFSIILK